MSASIRKNSWLKLNYEKLLLVVVLLILLCSAVLLVWQVMQKTAQQAAVQPSPPFVKAKAIDKEELRLRVAALQHTNLMDAARGVMGDELRVSCINPKCAKPIPYDTELCPFCAAKQPPKPKEDESTLGDIPDKWKKKYGFDPLDTTVANADTDGDGFSNLDEYRAGTDPLDPKSHPDVASKLCVWSVKKQPFKLRFTMAMTAGSAETFQVKNVSTGKSQFLKIGDTVEGYKILAHEAKAADGDVLVMDNGAEKLRLPKNKDLQEKADLSADLILMLDHKRYNNLVKGQSVKIREITYKIIDITTNAVTIRAPSPGNDVVVHLISDAQRSEVLGVVPGSAESPAPAATVPAMVPRSTGVRSEVPVGRLLVNPPAVPQRSPHSGGRGK